MTVATILDQAGNSLGEALPRIGGAFVLLVVGLLIAWLAGRLVGRGLQAAGFDGLADRFGFHDTIERIGLERSLSRLLGRIVRIALVIVVVVAAVSLLGFAALSGALNEVLLFLPKLIVALALVLIGVILGQFLGRRVDRVAQQMNLGGPLRGIAEGAIVALFVLTALAQLGIPTEILIVLVGILIIGAALTVALAFGLGSREVAREVAAGRYVESAFQLGQTVEVQQIRGEIVGFESSATVLRTADGRSVRIPNHLLVASIVTVYGQASNS